MARTRIARARAARIKAVRTKVARMARSARETVPAGAVEMMGI